MSRFSAVRGLVGMVTFACLVLGAGPVHSAEEPVAGSKIRRVVMHLNSGEEKVQKGMLNNIKNLYEGMGAE
jgi:hypothetical protein